MMKPLGSQWYVEWSRALGGAALLTKTKESWKRKILPSVKLAMTHNHQLPTTIAPASHHLFYPSSPDFLLE